jgi:hypothetical protein
MTKDQVRDAAFAATALGAGLAATGVGIPVAIFFLGLQAGMLAGLASREDVVAVQADPTNTGNYGQAAAFSFRHIGDTSPLSVTMNDVLASHATLITTTRTLSLSVARLKGAVQKRNSQDERLQHLYVTRLVASLEADLIRAIATLEHCSVLFRETEAAKLKITRDEVLSMTDKIVQEKKFPSSETGFIEEMKVTPHELELMLHGTTGSTLPPTMTVAEIIDMAATGYRALNAHELLPTDVGPIPTWKNLDQS